MSKPVSIIYMGRRLWQDSKVVHVFRHGKEEVGFAKVKLVMIGHAYEATGKGNSLSISQRPKRLSDEEMVDAATLAQWEAEDALVERHLREKRAVAKAKNHPGLLRAAEALKPYVAKLNYFERRALIEELLERLDK